MIYLLFGQQSVMLERRLKYILNENIKNLDDFNFVKINAKETSAQDIVYESSLLPIGYDKKAVVVYNPYFLSTEKEKVKFDVEQDLDELVKYIENPCETTDLFFMANYPKVNERSAIFKKIKEHGTVIELKDLTREEWPEFVRKYFSKFAIKIDADANQELVERVENDLNKFTNEAEKLALYTRHISLKDVELLVCRPEDANAFAIFDNLIHGNNKEAIRIYRELISHSEEPVRLIALLSTQFRTVAEVLYLLKDGKSVFEISHILGIHEYRVKLASINGKYIGYKNCMRVLNDLYYLDYSIKSGETLDRFYAFERFLINFKTRI